LGGSVCAGFGAALPRALEPDAIRQADLAFERARCKADRAFRQYDAVDPGNRQIVDELERLWNERLVATSEAEEALSRSREADRAYRMTDTERSARLDLGRDIERVSPELRKRTLRAALVEATACVTVSCTGSGRPQRDRHR